MSRSADHALVVLLTPSPLVPSQVPVPQLASLYLRLCGCNCVLFMLLMALAAWLSSSFPLPVSLCLWLSLSFWEPLCTLPSPCLHLCLCVFSLPLISLCLLVLFLKNNLCLFGTHTSSRYILFMSASSPSRIPLFSSCFRFV